MCLRHPEDRCAQSRDAPDTVKLGTTFSFHGLYSTGEEWMRGREGEPNVRIHNNLLICIYFVWKIEIRFSLNIFWKYQVKTYVSVHCFQRIGSTLKIYLFFSSPNFHFHLLFIIFLTQLKLSTPLKVILLLT